MNYFKSGFQIAIRKDMVYKIESYATNGGNNDFNIYGIRFYLLKENETEIWIFDDIELRDIVFNRILGES